MPDKISIHEKTLLHRLECPLRSSASHTLPESPVLTCSEGTARWLIAELFEGRAPSAAETREVFDAEWKQTTYFESRDHIPPKEYGIRVREGIHACSRVRDIAFRCEVLQPVSPYALPVGDVVITGAYAILRSSRRKKHAFALYLRHKGVRLRRLVPDVISFARRLDLGNRCIDPANRHWGINAIGVMNYWVSSDLAAEHRLDRDFAEEILLGAVNVVTGNPFPVPGDHCKSCPTRACRPDDLVRPPKPGFASNLLSRMTAATVRQGEHKADANG